MMSTTGKMRAHIEDCASGKSLEYMIFCLLGVLRRRSIPFPKITLSKGFCRAKVSERHLQKYMIPKHNGCFVDAGANFGIWTFHVAKHNITVHAFEPSPRPYRLLKEKSKRYANIHIYPYALGESFYKARINIHKRPGNNSLVMRRNNFTGTSIRTIVRTLDSFRLQNVGLIKIDTEGYEIPILLGAKETIRRDKPRLVIEVHRPYEEQVRDIFGILKQLDYYWVIKYKGTKPHIIADHKTYIF